MRVCYQKMIFVAALMLTLTCGSAAQGSDFKVGELSAGLFSFTTSTVTLAERFEAAFDDGTDILPGAFFVVREGDTYWLQGSGDIAGDLIRNFATQLDTVRNGDTEELWLKPYLEKRVVDCLNECRRMDNYCKPNDSNGDGIENSCWPICSACREESRSSASLTAFWISFMASY